MKDLMQDITIYHKNGNNYTRYNLKASVRNTSNLSRNKSSVQTSDNTLIRIFNIDEYNLTFKCEKGDIIVLKSVKDNIVKAPITELREKYGKTYVVEVTSIDIFNFNDRDVKELNHIKIGAK